MITEMFHLLTILTIITSATSSSIKTSNGRIDFWSKFNKIDEAKPSSWGTSKTTSGRPILERFRFVLQPIWWSDEDKNDPNNAIDAHDFDVTNDRVTTYYHKQSWNLTDLEWIHLEQKVLPISQISPNFGETETAGKVLVDASGLVEGTDYDGIMEIYNNADTGPLAGSGGWGQVNGDFVWMSNPLGYSVVRHEVGHNFGHRK